LDFIKDLRAQKSEMPILVLSMHQESLYAERVLQSGGRGYIGKSQPASELKRAIREILRGEVYLSSEMISNLLKRIASGDATVVKTGVESLSDRELEIFRMLGEGGNMKEIAKALNLGNSTVESYRAHIRQKLGVASAAQLYSVAAIWVREQKL
ncbi:MAG: response regulator transcription factor, partial [Verrucomicrobiales bacterium]